MPETDPSDVIHDAINNALLNLVSLIRTGYNRFVTNVHASFADVSKTRWTKVILSVVGYIIVRPYIERFFRWSSDRERARKAEKEKQQAEATGMTEGMERPKVSANSLRGGAGETGGKQEGGKVLGEVENTDDEVGSEDEEESEAIKFARASGVPEWGKNARKRQKKGRKMKESAHGLTDEQLMDLLDWSDSDEGKN